MFNYSTKTVLSFWDEFLNTDSRDWILNIAPKLTELEIKVQIIEDEIPRKHEKFGATIFLTAETDISRKSLEGYATSLMNAITVANLISELS